MLKSSMLRMVLLSTCILFTNFKRHLLNISSIRAHWNIAIDQRYVKLFSKQNNLDLNCALFVKK